MKEEFISYLRQIELPAIADSKIEEIIKFYEGLSLNVEMIFITDYLQSEGQRTHENFWLITDKGFCEAKNFLTEDKFDYTPYNKLTRWEVSKKEYNFKIKPTDASRLTLYIGTVAGVYCQLKASKENCEYLEAFFRVMIDKCNTQ